VLDDEATEDVAALDELSTTSEDESACVAVVDLPAQETSATVAAIVRNA